MGLLSGGKMALQNFASVRKRTGGSREEYPA